MVDHVYKLMELVGSSETTIEDAIEGAIDKASQTIRHMRWFEVTQVRGHIEAGKLSHYQVTLKAGFAIEDEGAKLEPKTGGVGANTVRHHPPSMRVHVRMADGLRLEPD